MSNDQNIGGKIPKVDPYLEKLFNPDKYGLKEFYRLKNEEHGEFEFGDPFHKPSKESLTPEGQKKLYPVLKKDPMRDIVNELVKFKDMDNTSFQGSEFL